MTILLVNLDIYADGHDFTKIKAIKTKNLRYSDLFHFGWNIWNHFGVSRNQLVVVDFLKRTFNDDLKSFEEELSIKKKLRVSDTKSVIDIEHKL